MARTNDNRYEQSPIPLASLKASDHPARGGGAAARIRTVNTLLTKQPRCRCATAARFRQPRYPDRMAPAGYTGGGRSRAVSGVFCSKLPIQKRTGCRWPWVTQPWTARRVFAPFQNAIPAALEDGHVLALRVVPCRPGRLRGTCRRVQLRAQWTVGERSGRSGISLNPHDTQAVLALVSTRICQRVDLFASWSQPRAPDIGISAIAILLETGTWELVETKRFERSTSGLQSRHSAVELRPHVRLACD